jgi:hypothetical protein
MPLYIQFTDATQTAIISYFACQQDPSVWENLGQVDSNDARWKTFYDSQPAVMQSALPAPTT